MRAITVPTIKLKMTMNFFEFFTTNLHQTNYSQENHEPPSASLSLVDSGFMFSFVKLVFKTKAI